MPMPGAILQPKCCQRPHGTKGLKPLEFNLFWQESYDSPIAPHNDGVAVGIVARKRFPHCACYDKQCLGIEYGLRKT